MAINNPVIADADIIQDTAVAIQEKDHGGKMEHPDIPSRIRALPTNLIPKTITENGVYNASSDNADGYDVVTVSVTEKNTLDELLADTLEVANIPSVTSIPQNFFQKRKKLTDVIMPNVTSIGYYAFTGCTNLSLTSLPSGITSIGDFTFDDCRKLSITSLPNGVNTIRGYAFRDCRGIPFLDFSNFDHVITLMSTTAFNNTNFPFYFRDQQQLDEWAAATNWSSLASRFQIKPSEAS